MPTMNDNFFTPVVTSTSQSCEQCPAVLPLAPRPSTKLLPSEALLLGPSFPNLSTPPYFPHDLLMSESSEGDQGGDGRSNYFHARGCSCIGKNHEHRCRTLAPPAIIRLRLRPRCSGYTRNANASSAVSIRATPPPVPRWRKNHPESAGRNPAVVRAASSWCYVPVFFMVKRISRTFHTGC